MSRDRGFPDNGELVVCTVTSVKNFGAFVTLDEYDAKEGFIHVRDLASGWVKYVRDFIREGQKVVCKVQGVDSTKGHIDLSLKSVNDHQKREKIQQWKNEKKAEKLLEIVADRLSIKEDKAWDTFGNQLVTDYETLYAAFEAVASDPEGFRSGYKGKWVDTFIEVAQENVVLPNVEISGHFELKSYEPDGVEDIRKALEDGLAAAEGANVQITAVGSPNYRIVISAEEYKEAEDVLKKVSTVVIKTLTKCGGEASLKRDS